MPTKSNEWKSKPKKGPLITNKRDIEAASGPKELTTRTKTPKPYNQFDAERKTLQKRKTKSRVRGLFSLGTVAYLSYYTLYACGSPFDGSIEKAAICTAIDPIKLDMYALYQSNFYKLNVNPYVAPIASQASELYHDYGIPAQLKFISLYQEHGKPHIEQGYIEAQKVYKSQLLPFYSKKVAPIVNQAKPYYQNNLLMNQAYEAQAYIQYNLDNLSPSIKQAQDTAKDTIIYWVDRAENTDLLPILVKIYWSIIDFYQFEVIPVLNSSHVVTQIKLYYENNVKSYYQAQVKPILVQVNHRVHLDQILLHLKYYLPQRPVGQEEIVYTAATASTHVKTDAVTPTTKGIPITPVAAPVKTVTVSQKNKSDSSVAFSSSAVVKISTTTTTSSQNPQSTIGHHVSNDDDIKTHVESNIKPSVTHQEFADGAPDADKKEAIYCPTCNSVEEQLIVAPTDKNVATVRTDKHVIAVPTDKDLFDLHPADQHIVIPVQPTSPNKDQEKKPNVVAIQAPIPSNTVAEDDIVYSIQTEVPTVSGEETVFSIQTEVPTVSEKEEESVFSIQTEVPIVAAIVNQIVIKNVEEVNQEIAQEIRHEEKLAQEIKREENIFVPPAVEKKELVLESEKEAVNNEAVFVKVEEPIVKVEEPVVKIEEPVVQEPAAKKVSQPVVKKDEKPVIKMKAPFSAAAKEQVEKAQVAEE